MLPAARCWLLADIVAKVENRTIQKFRQSDFLDASTTATRSVAPMRRSVVVFV
jgi:hypothetical protein